MANPAHDTEGVARNQPGSGQPPRPATFVAQIMAELRKQLMARPDANPRHMRVASYWKQGEADHHQELGDSE